MLFNREPVLFSTAVRATVIMATAFGLSLTPEQIGGVMLFTEAMLGLFVRRQVSPTAPVAATAVTTEPFPAVPNATVA